MDTTDGGGYDKALEKAQIPPGVAEYRFLYTRYTFQKSDHWFAVVIEVARNTNRDQAARELCVRPTVREVRYE